MLISVIITTVAITEVKPDNIFTFTIALLSILNIIAGASVNVDVTSIIYLVINKY